MSEIHRCTRCNEKLNPKTMVWLELSNTDGKYYPEGELPEGHVSQGGFEFGRACAKSELRETFGENVQADIVRRKIERI
jgi:hypothetical protein